jgi:diguanylate cyclase (GGDEF)-like protein
VLWRRLDEEPDHTCRVSLDRLVRLSSLVFEREGAAAALRHTASHDTLTGLANRAVFFQRLQDTLDDPASGPHIGVLYIDLDGFKPVNDRLGHGVGDVVLREVGRRLASVVRDTDLVARIGGDEFTVLCPDIPHAGVLEDLAERLVSVVRAPIAIGDQEVSVGASVGVAMAEPASCSIDVLIDAADRALYRVKGANKGGWELAGSPGPGSPGDQPT